MFRTYHLDIPKRLAISEIVSGFLGPVHLAVFLTWDFRSGLAFPCTGRFLGESFGPWVSSLFSLRRRFKYDKLTVGPDFESFFNSSLFESKSGNKASTRDFVLSLTLKGILQPKKFEVPQSQGQLMADHADAKLAEPSDTGNLGQLFERKGSQNTATSV